MGKDSKGLVAIQECKNYISALQSDFEKKLTDDVKISFERESLFAIQSLQKNDFLVSTAMGNPESLKNAILNVASIGISLNPAKKSAYLVPRDGAVMLDVSYMGMVEIATTSGSIAFVQSKLVYKNDTFEYKGISSEPLHNFSPFSERGEVVGVYCIAKTAKGDFLTEMMTIEECHSIRNRTKIWIKSKAGPWKTDPGEMMKKTVTKRAYKMWPRPDINSQRIENVIELMNSNDSIDFEKERRGEPASENQLKQINELIFDMEKIDEAAFKKYLSSEAKTKIEEYAELSTSEAEKAISLLGQKRDAETKKAGEKTEKVKEDAS